MAETRDSIEDIRGERSPCAGEDHWPERVDERPTETPQRWVHSASVLMQVRENKPVPAGLAAHAAAAGGAAGAGGALVRACEPRA